MPNRAYLRLDPGLRRHKRDYPDGAFRAFVEVLCAADGQERRGRFESRGMLRALLGPRGRWIPFLLAHADIVEGDDGELYVNGWDEWQEGDVAVAERLKAIRARQGTEAGPVPGVLRTAKWRQRGRIFERDSFTCRYCGNNRYPRQWLILEHVDPAGGDEDANLVTACRPCNKVKGPHTPEQAGMPLLASGEVRHPPIAYAQLYPYQGVTRDESPNVTRDVTSPPATVRRRPSSGGISTSRGKDKSIFSSASPSHRAPARPPRPGRSGASFLNLPETDERYPVAKLLATRFRYREVTEAQWETLAELVDNEYPVGTAKGKDRHAAWVWLAELMAKLKRNAGDPIEAALAEVNARIEARKAKAAADEEQWTEQKHQGPTHPALATGAKQLAKRVDPRPNGKVTPAQREAAISMLRDLQGLIEEPRWSQLLKSKGLTAADLERAGQ